jgi:IS4 transposase
MRLGEVFERFIQQAPISVMFRTLLEHALDPAEIDRLFEENATRQYTREVLFSAIVELMGAVVCGAQPSVRAAYLASLGEIAASLTALYEKLKGLEPGVCRAFVLDNAGRLAPLVRQLDATLPQPVPGYRAKILDGNHLAGTEHRVPATRTTRAAALPGQSLVVLDPATMLVIDVVPCEDAHAQERSLIDQVLPGVEPGDLWIADRNFCTTDFLFGIARRDAFFVIRQHASTLHWTFVGKRRACGRIDTGKVYEQTIRATNDGGEILILRRVTVLLDRPTRDGETELHLLTNVPVKDARAKVIADLYRRRWTIETAFQELEATLNSEITTLGYPKAALFAFCVALVSYNVLSTLKAALRSVHGEDVVAEEVSGFYVADEIQMTHRGMMIAIPEDEWVVFHDLTPVELADVLVRLARSVSLPKLRKHPRGPKKPKPKKQSGAKIKHVATAKILEARHTCTK